MMLGFKCPGSTVAHICMESVTSWNCGIFQDKIVREKWPGSKDNSAVHSDIRDQRYSYVCCCWLIIPSDVD